MTHDSDASDILILIPAAGASSRMRGRDKLLELVDGQPLLVRQVARALQTGGARAGHVGARSPGARHGVGAFGTRAVARSGD